MPGVQIDFDQETFDKIPRPKRKWIRELVEAAVMDKKSNEVVEHVQELEYAFRTDDGIKIATGISPAAAASKLGLGMTVEWRFRAEAEKEGWLNKDPLNV